MEIVQIVNTVFSSNTYVLREEGMDWRRRDDSRCFSNTRTLRSFVWNQPFDRFVPAMRGVHVGGGSGRNLFGQVEFFEIS